MAKTYAQKGPLELGDPPADGAFLRNKPGMFLDVPDIHRAAHDPQCIVVFQSWNLIASVKLDSTVFNAVGAQKLPKYAGMLAVNVLEDEELHWTICLPQWNQKKLIGPPEHVQ